MRSSVPPSLLAVVASGIIVAATWARCPGCLDRSRVNEECDWIGDAAIPFDANDPASRQHLVGDAQLAEDLATRYADAEHGRRYGWHGHGGLIDHGRVVRECYARLVSIIETNHAVTPEQIQVAASHRTVAFDTGVWLSFILLYGLAAVAACRWLDRAFAETAGSVALAITKLTSVAISFLGVQVGTMWTMGGEIVRLHNDHFGRRATRPPWTEHLGGLFIGGMILFWIIVLLRHRTARRDEMTDSVPARLSIVLR